MTLSKTMKTEKLRIGNYVKETVDNKDVTIASIFNLENKATNYNFNFS